MDVRNTSKRPLVVPLPGGKKLRLAPGRTGQIAPKDADHPPVRALIDANELEIVSGGRSQGGGGGVSGGPGSGSGPSAAGGGVRHTGDR